MVGFLVLIGLKPGNGAVDANFLLHQLGLRGATVGILLALGRRSHMPIVRILSVILSSSGAAYR